MNPYPLIHHLLLFSTEQRSMIPTVALYFRSQRQLSYLKTDMKKVKSRHRKRTPTLQTKEPDHHWKPLVMSGIQWSPGCEIPARCLAMIFKKSFCDLSEYPWSNKDDELYYNCYLLQSVRQNYQRRAREPTNLLGNWSYSEEKRKY